MILLIDNFDSFTYNLAHLVKMSGHSDVVVRKNNVMQLSDVAQMAPDGIVISPGPGRPEDAGISTEIVKAVIFGEMSIPLLGVCLGHQVIAMVAGAAIAEADRIMHGKTSDIVHNGHALFAGIPERFTAVRYHSLLIKPESVPKSLRVIARTREAEIMALAVKNKPVFGVQFHPESVLTTHGGTLMKNFLQTVVHRQISARKVTSGCQTDVAIQTHLLEKS
jgi:para-aminobenzoate synthetase component 2